MTTETAPKPLVDFAFKKRSPMDAASNALVNAMVTLFLLAGTASVPVVSPAGSEFAKSLLESATAVLRTPEAAHP